ncbi:dihydrofolate reductase family protein [Sphingomonas albertensis]|uniref:Dihydrofolate reductase family protein n=1 Tax=Sphingomonas albertensis TaxID=2762591 RepID=A0ABR7APQ9_9SPHN|nr:dihydrofolate reductase family protein [Sphingomonas albertensis]MBC3942447.1 dihydrofolate reductase family protein [Sphingomonas albertensis]
MMVRVDLLMSVDGFASTTDQTAENPFGRDRSRLVETYVATRTFREHVFSDSSGTGTTGVDDRYARHYFDGIGAEIMGAGKFGFHAFPEDPDWRGWWGGEPPFRCPVFVLTHRSRPPLAMKGGTNFNFVSANPTDALAQAKKAANGKDVRIGGGPTVVREYLKAGRVDHLHVAIAPILLGRGVRLWNDLRGLDAGYTVDSETAESGTIHLTFRR